jgi:transcriptional regulator
LSLHHDGCKVCLAADERIAAMLYTPSAFREDDVEAMHAHIAATGLACLVTVGAAGPLVSHVPLRLDRQAGPFGTLSGHLARANPQLEASDLSKPALAVFLLADAYVSPSWYASKAEHGRVVPTWNYSVVHARGTLELFDDREALMAQVAALTDRHEARFDAPWQASDAPADYLERQLRAIVGVQLRIEALEGKAKLSQNQKPADYAGVVAGLGASESEADRTVAAMMAAKREA